MRIVFDTNFIMTCIKQKIDFIEELFGNELLLPKQVIKELENIYNEKSKRMEERELAKVSLAFLEKFKSKFIEINLEKKFVDLGLEKFQEADAVATLDKELQNKLKGRFKFLIITKRKKLELIN